MTETMAMTTISSFNPSSGESVATGIAPSTMADVDALCAAADAAFDLYGRASAETRAALLDGIASAIEAIGDELVVTCMAETGLPRARIEGERGRTSGQLRLFARFLRDGGADRQRIDPACAAHPELVMRMIPLGPVAVFGASNFPLAFSVAGGDTAAALAAGCPVVVKAHPAHPLTSRLVADAVSRAVAACGLDAGCFGMLFDTGHAIGEALVRDHRIKAVGFTGSRKGGLALVRIAQARPEPIPVYAEMGSINPVLLLPAALAERSAQIAEGFATALLMGVGQFCTSPGVVIALTGPELDDFTAQAVSLLADASAGTMLTPVICKAYADAVTALAETADVEHLVVGEASGCRAAPGLFATTAAAFLRNPMLHEEIFGPVALIVRCDGAAELRAVLDALEGQLSASIHAAPADAPIARDAARILERKAGRVIFDGFGTGVAVSPAMVHGGPFPASSDGRSTSVGTLAIERFQRPVCYQNLPPWLR